MEQRENYILQLLTDEVWIWSDAQEISLEVGVQLDMPLCHVLKL